MRLPHEPIDNTMARMNIPLSLYIHFPWCLKRCPYCDFNAHALKGELPEQNYINALLADLRHQLSFFGNDRPIHSVFMGGGTPSLIQPSAIKHLFTQMNELIELPDDTEITMEANPGSIMDESQLAAYRDAGVNRLSVGIQSFNAKQLKTLGRIHDSKQALTTVESAHKAGFKRINADIMYGLPNQTLDEALSDVMQACELPIDHFSWYQLTIEPNTLFHHQRPTLPDEDTIELIEQQGRSFLQSKGFERYEVSAYSKKSPSQHNLNYWQCGDYLGIGAGAHGKITDLKKQSITRTRLFKHPTRYLGATPDERFTAETVANKEHAFECALNAFRLTDGFSESIFKERCFGDHALTEALLIEAEQKQWITRQNGFITPTKLGQRYLNDLTSLFLSSEN